MSRSRTRAAAAILTVASLVACAHPAAPSATPATATTRPASSAPATPIVDYDQVVAKALGATRTVSDADLDIVANLGRYWRAWSKAAARGTTMATEMLDRIRAAVPADVYARFAGS